MSSPRPTSLFYLCRARPWWWSGPIILLTIVVATRIGGPLSVSAQVSAESIEEACVALRDYKLQDDELPSGYAIDSEQAYGNEAQALESTTGQPPDPRPVEALLEPLEASGRVVRVRQVLNKPGEPKAAELLFNVVLFRTPEGAAAALKDPSLVLFTPPELDVTSVAQAPIGDGATAFQLDTLDEAGEVQDRSRAVFWRRGRVAFAVVAGGPPDVAVAAGADLGELLSNLAQQHDAAYAANPLPPR